MTTANPPAVTTRTVVSGSTSGHRFVSAFGLTGSGDPPTSQVIMKAAIFEELKDSTFAVDLTAQGAPLHANPDDVQRVLNHLDFNHVTLVADGHSATGRGVPLLPHGGFKAEADLYEPLTQILNAIIDATNFCLTGPRYLAALRFHRHDAQMQDTLDSERSLKPDIVGHPLHKPDGKLSWKDVTVFLEVKNRPRDAFKQLATYARCHLALDRRRSFSIAMTFSHKEMELCFYCFHRSGVSFSPQLRLDREDGFKCVIKHMVGIMSIPDEAAFGLDATRVKDVYRINSRNYDIVRTIQRRASIRGHSTIVYSLKLQTTGLDTPAGLQSRELTCVEEIEWPEKIVYKLSYQPKGWPSEGTLFSHFHGQFGIVDIVGSYICSADDLFGSTERYLLNAVFSPIGDPKEDAGKKRTPEPEIRNLHCVAMALEGLPLVDTSDPDTTTNIPTPPDLVETILHSIFGHYNLFLGGILHRDVSSGNILRLQEPIKRIPGRSKDLLAKMLGQNVDLYPCRGILIDGDHAIDWRKDGIAQSQERSGTLPFMSAHLLDTWDVGARALHTAADDLESFLWVLVWSLIRIFKKLAANIHEDSIISRLERAFSSRSFIGILDRERLVKIHWKDRVFADLIEDWLHISLDSQVNIRKLEKRLLGLVDDRDAENGILDELDEHCKKVYEDFIQIGYNRLHTIRTKFPNWGEVMNANGNSSSRALNT